VAQIVPPEIFNTGALQCCVTGLGAHLLSAKVRRQATLLDDPTALVRSDRLMAVMDAINGEFGREMLRSGSSGFKKRWAMRAENRSPRYTTRWDELPVVT
jgi:DNA polymerase V